jgi:hypothetical protein
MTEWGNSASVRTLIGPEWDFLEERCPIFTGILLTNFRVEYLRRLCKYDTFVNDYIRGGIYRVFVQCFQLSS